MKEAIERGWARRGLQLVDMVGYHFGILRAIVLSAAIFFVCALTLHGAINQSCRTGSNARSIRYVHGRLSVYNGGYPNLRLWKIGTHHLFGIYSDPADLKCGRGSACAEDQNTKLPSNLQHLNLLKFSVYGDFEIRILEPFQPGHMQAACIIAAQKIVRSQ